MPRGQYPRTPEQWQFAVDGAYACLLLDSARQYGLVTGGPHVKVDRCVELLARGAAKGFVPDEDKAVDFIAAFNAETQARE